MDPTSYNLPPDYIYSDQPFGILFFKLYDGMNYLSAQKKCKQDGAALPVPKSMEENEYFGNLGRNQGKHIWLGINDIANEGEFVDNDGQAITFQNWNTGNPGNSGPDSNEDAVELQAVQSDDFKWNDLSINNDKPSALCVFFP